MNAKDYLDVMGIEDDTIYDNAERMHSLECLLEDYCQEKLKLLNLPSISHCALKQIETVMIEASKCEAKFQMKYVDFDSFTVPSKITENRIDNILGDRSIEIIRIDIEHCG